MKNSFNFQKHTVTTEELSNYLEYIDSNAIVSLNQYIENTNYPAQENIIIIASLDDKEFSDLDLSKVDLQGSIVTNNLFNNCNFDGAILRDVDLTDSAFTDCAFINTDFRGANLHYTDFNYSDINDDTLTITNLSAKFSGAHFSFTGLEKLNKYINEDIAREDQEDTLRMFCGANLEGIFEQFQEEKINIKFDPSYIIGSSHEERSKEKIYQQITRTDLEKFLAQASAADQRLSFKEDVVLDFSDHDFSGLEFKNVDLSRSIFPENLMGCKFINCNLSKTRFDGVNLQNAVFDNVDASDSNFLFANLAGIKIINSDLQRAYMAKTKLPGAEIQNSNLEGAILINTDADKIKASDINLSNANLTGVSLAYAQIQKIKLERSILQRAVLGNANCTEANLREVDASSANLNNTILDNVDASWINLSNTTAQNISAKSANFVGANMYRLQGENSDFTSANLNGVNLHGANIARSNVDGANFDNSKMNAETQAHQMLGKPTGEVKYTHQNGVTTDRETEEVFKEKDREYKIKNSRFIGSKIGQGIIRLGARCVRGAKILAQSKLVKALAIIGGVAIASMAFASLTPILIPTLVAFKLSAAAVIGISAITSATCGLIGGIYINKHNNKAQNFLDARAARLENYLLPLSPPKSATPTQPLPSISQQPISSHNSKVVAQSHVHRLNEVRKNQSPNFRGK
jgi:uncharacterized protein YjbI with pentapeptide repeats